MIAQRLLVTLLLLNLSPILCFTAAPTARTRTTCRTHRRAPCATSTNRIARSTSSCCSTTVLLSATETKTPAARIAKESVTPVTKRRKSLKWDRMIAHLERYHKQQGHSLVPGEHNAELADWCKTIRRNYSHQLAVGDDDNLEREASTTRRRPTLSKEKLQLLQKLDFVWNVQDYLWNQRFEELCAFRATHQHCQVPSHCNNKETPLAMWVHNQKCQYRLLRQGGAYSSLTPERLQALASIGLWDTLATHDDLWNTRLSELQDFRDTHGHSNVPEDYMEHYSLGQWVMNQRLHYKRYVAGLTSPLTPDRIAALEALDFRWNLHSYHWFGMLERLREYATVNDHVRVSWKKHDDTSTSNDDSLRDLQLWLIQQRHAYQRKLQGRPSSMTDTRQAALESIPKFAWKAGGNAAGGPSADDWQELFQGLRAKGIVPGIRPKEHWFEGQNPFQEEENNKEIYDDDDLLDLWNQEGDDEEEAAKDEEFNFDLLADI